MTTDRARFAVPTARAAFLIRKAGKEGVTVYDVRIGEKRTSFSVAKVDERALDRILTAEGLRGKRLRERAGKRILSFVKARPLLVIASVVALCSVAFFQSFVYRAEIRGNTFVNTKTIAAVLKAHKIDGFTFKGKVDVPSIRKDVASIEGISFASVRVKGNKLFVDVKEELPPSEADEVSFDPIVSKVSAVITKIVAESGTPRVKIGDRVSAGDVLIDPVYSFTEGEAAAPAKGEVYGMTTYERRIALPEISVQNELTGKKKSFRRILLFGREWGKAEEPPFASFDLSERIVFSSVGNALRVVERTYFERKDVTVYHDFGIEVPARIEKERQAILSSVPFYASAVGGVTVEQKKMDNILYIVLYYTVVQRLDSLFSPE